MTKELYFDCACGAAGDMIVGALIDIGVDSEKLFGVLKALPVTGYTLEARKVKKKGILATKFSVELDPNQKQPQRHLRHILEILNKSELPEGVKSASAATFRRIAEAEATVHGSSIERVHFHEVGAVDAIVDVVGAHYALHELGCARITCSALHVGSGTVTCEHGVMPVPAPATALILRDIPIYSGTTVGELVTPTGAALLAQVAESFGPLPAMRMTALGHGSGTRDLPDRANVLRIMMGVSENNKEAFEPVTVIETNLDDMTPELLPVLMEQVLSAGARDAFLTPIYAKKGRPAHLVTVLCDEALVSMISALLFRHSTTFGLRMRTERRMCLARRWVYARTPWGAVRVKIGTFQGTDTVSSPEFEDCKAASAQAGVPIAQVYQAAIAAVTSGDLTEINANERAMEKGEG